MYKDKYLFYKIYVSVMYVCVHEHICMYVMVHVYFLLLAQYRKDRGIYLLFLNVIKYPKLCEGYIYTGKLLSTCQKVILQDKMMSNAIYILCVSL